MPTLTLVRVALLALTLLAGPAAATPRGLTAGAVASPDRYGALAAQEVLKAGGNAVDAAVATAFALAVTYPEAGNLGGGGFMTLYVDGKPYFLDYRETAPAKASANMYLDAKGQPIVDLEPGPGRWPPASRAWCAAWPTPTPGSASFSWARDLGPGDPPGARRLRGDAQRRQGTRRRGAMRSRRRTSTATTRALKAAEPGSANRSWRRPSS